MLSCGLVINHPGGGADSGIASLAKPVPAANTLISAYSDTGPLNLASGRIHALKPETSGQAVLAFVLASNSALLDLHCRRRYGDKRGRFALRDIIRVVFSIRFIVSNPLENDRQQEQPGGYGGQVQKPS